MKSSIHWSSIACLFGALLVGCGGSSSDGGLPVGASAISADAKSAQSATSAASTTATAQESAGNSSAQQAQAETAQNAAIPTHAAVIESKLSEGPRGREINPFKNIGAKLHPSAVQIGLPALVAVPETIQKSVVVDGNVPLRIGVPRAVEQTADKQGMAAMFAWQNGERGAKVAALRFLSPGAKGVRLGVVVKALPFGAKLRFYVDGSDTYFEVPGLEVLNTLQRSRDAGDLSEAAMTYWSPNLGGEAVTMEIEVPSQADTELVDLSVPRLSHATVDVRKLDPGLKIGQSGSCNLDVSCTTAYDQLKQSVALMDFVSDGSGGTTAGANYVCTGTLMNDRMSTGTPWFLTAKHCISTQTVASTLYTYWFYRSASCNSSTLHPGNQVLTTGATLLFTSPDVATGQPLQGDTSFMRLNSTPPAGALYAGSSSFSVTPATSVYGVHHPKGDIQKYSSGMTVGTTSCTASTCTPSVASSARFLSVSWSAGTTEGGSSGSGLFMKMNGKDYLVGQLFGGVASCSNPTGTDYYGRFDTVSASLAPWLSATSTASKLPVFRMYNTRDRTHFYTSDPVERDYILTKSTIFNYEGVGFFAYVAAAPGTAPVHRFYNSSTNTHFYTIDEQERQHVQTLNPPFSYDGVAWFGGTSSANGAAPMYRFYNRATRTHFYTMSSVERDYVQQNSTDFQLDGIAYFAWVP
ncbi:MAG: trypsin-like serine protease [Rhodospirillales bacterium]|nr:trypsin-like serine protease [Acetobacter sp.]